MGRVTSLFHDVAGLFKSAAVNWVRDYAQSMGAALAFYTMFSIAPFLLIVIAVAGIVFGEEAARGEQGILLPASESEHEVVLGNVI